MYFHFSDQPQFSVPPLLIFPHLYPLPKKKQNLCCETPSSRCCMDLKKYPKREARMEFSDIIYNIERHHWAKGSEKLNIATGVSLYHWKISFQFAKHWRAVQSPVKSGYRCPAFTYDSTGQKGVGASSSLYTNWNKLSNKFHFSLLPNLKKYFKI